PLRRGVVAVPPQPGLLREKFSGRHRHRPPRQTHYNGCLCALSQSHLCGVLDHPAGPVPGIPQLAPVGLSRRRHLVAPPSSAARRSLPDPTLWQGIRGVLCSRKEIRLSPTGPPTNSLEPTWASHGERLGDTSLGLARRLGSRPFGGITLVASHSYVNATRPMVRCVLRDGARGASRDCVCPTAGPAPP